MLALLLKKIKNKNHGSSKKQLLSYLRISNRYISSFKKEDDFHIIGKKNLQNLKRAYTFIDSLERDCKGKGIYIISKILYT